MMGKEAAIVTHKDRFPPGMFGSTTVDIALKTTEMGLDKENMFALNRERYMYNLNLLNKDGMKLAIMPDQTQEMVLAALHQDPSAFAFVKDQTETIREYALTKNVNLIRYFDNPTPTEQIFAFVADHTIVRFLDEIDEDTLNYMIENNPGCFSKLQPKFRTKENFLLFIEHYTLYKSSEPGNNPLHLLSEKVRTFSLIEAAIKKDINYFFGLDIEIQFKYLKKHKDFAIKLNENFNYIPGGFKNSLKFFELGVTRMFKRINIKSIDIEDIDIIEKISINNDYGFSRVDIFKMFENSESLPTMFNRDKVSEFKEFFEYVQGWYFNQKDSAAKNFIKYQIRKHRKDLLFKVTNVTYYRRFLWYIKDEIITPLFT